MKRDRGKAPRQFDAANTLTVVPHSVDAEQALLGALMLDDSSWTAVSERISADDFYRLDHQLIFGTIAELARRGESRDAITVCDELDRSQRLAEGGGAGYIARLPRETVSVANIAAHADIVRKYGRMRRIAKLASKLQAVRDPTEFEIACDDLITHAKSGADTQAKTAPLQLRSLSEFVVRPKVSWLVRDLLPAEAIMVVFGAPKSGKTFTVCDIAMHAAHGMHWRGYTVSRALRVVFLAGEGHTALRVRLHAWLAEHAPEHEGNISLLPEAVALPQRVLEVANLLSAYQPDLVIVDTLNAFFGPGDENSTQDMSEFVAAMRHLRDQLKCGIIIIHHTGLADGARERGSSVLRGAADVIAQCARDEAGSGLVGFQVIAGRDLEPWSEALGLRLRSTKTDWADDEGHALSTCVVESTDQVITLPGRGGKPLSDGQNHLITAVKELAAAKANGSDRVMLSRGEIASRATELGAARSSIYRNIHTMAARMGWRLVEPGSLEVRHP